MNDILESEETFKAYATIDAGYFMINQIHNEMNKKSTPLNEAIDKATGFDKKIQNDRKKELVIILKDIIEAKKSINADYSNDKKLLLNINK